MRRLGFISASVALLGLLVGCSPTQVEEFVDALTKIPYVDRTEKEVNDWFDNRVIIDDTKVGILQVTNGEPKVLLLDPNSSHEVNGISYPNVLCVTQENTDSNGVKFKYAAHVVIKVLDTPKLFEAGKMELAKGALSCDKDVYSNMTIEALRPGNGWKEVEKAFRDAVNQWLQEDIVATLKSDKNTDRLEGFANPEPRNQAKYRGVKYAVIEDKGPPVVWSISFIAE